MDNEEKKIHTWTLEIPGIEGAYGIDFANPDIKDKSAVTITDPGQMTFTTIPIEPGQEQAFFEYCRDWVEQIKRPIVDIFSKNIDYLLKSKHERDKDFHFCFRNDCFLEYNGRKKRKLMKDFRKRFGIDAYALLCAIQKSRKNLPPEQSSVSEMKTEFEISVTLIGTETYHLRWAILQNKRCVPLSKIYEMLENGDVDEPSKIVIPHNKKIVY